MEGIISIGTVRHTVHHYRTFKLRVGWNPRINERGHGYIGKEDWDVRPILPQLLLGGMCLLKRALRHVTAPGSD